LSLARNTAVIGGLTLVSRVFGFARDLVLAAALGAGPVSDAFNAALRFPNLFRRLFAEGAFTQAFAPQYAKRLEAEGPEIADRLAGEALSVLLAVTGAATGLAMLAMPAINSVIFAGYRDDPETFALANTLTMITMSYLIAITAATVFSSMLNARGRFFAAAAAPILLNLCLLAAVWPVRDDPQTAAYAAAAAVAVSGVLQALWVWLAARRSGVRTRLRAPRLTPDVKAIIALAVPGAIAGGALQVNIMTSQALASFEEGAITFLNVADRLYQLPLGLIGIAVGVAMLPRLSRMVVNGDQDGARAAMDEAVALAMAFTLPAAAAMMAAPVFLIDGLFSRGAFTSDDAAMVGMALLHYGWGVPAFVLAKIYAPAFFARDDTRAPMRYAIVSMILNISFGAALFFSLRAMGLPGFPGLAIATSLAAWVNVALMVRALVRRGAYKPTRAAWGRLLRIGLATAALWLVMAGMALNREALTALMFGSKEIAIAAFIFGGGGFYFLCAFLFRAVTVAEVRAAFRRERGPSSPVLPTGMDG
jgi:putative peptidoglycan lipid II flippase